MPTGKGPKYDHWVVFEDLQVSGKVVTINIWTWAAHYTARVDAAVAPQYFPQLVAATFS